MFKFPNVDGQRARVDCGFALLLALTLAVAGALEATRLPVRAALNFTSGTSNRANCGSATSLDNLTAGTVLAWVYPTSLKNDDGITTKFGTGGYRNFSGVSSGNLRFDAKRATSDLIALSSTAPLTTNAWQFVGAVYDTAGVNGDEKLYHGTLTAAVTEVGGYSVQQVGSGPVTSDASNDLHIGNFGNVTWGTFAGRIGWVAVWNRVLSPAEIRAQQFRPFCRSTDGCVLFVHLGWAGTDTQPDLSGNGNNCTVTGATVADHAPLARWP